MHVGGKNRSRDRISLFVWVLVLILVLVIDGRRSSIIVTFEFVVIGRGVDEGRREEHVFCPGRLGETLSTALAEDKGDGEEGGETKNGGDTCGDDSGA